MGLLDLNISVLCFVFSLIMLDKMKLLKQLRRLKLPTDTHFQHAVGGSRLPSDPVTEQVSAVS